MYGVSPAYFYSSYGPEFRPSDIEAALPGIRELGFENFQPEAFRRDAAESWTERDSASLAARARDLGLSTGPFVAHWLGAEFSTPDALGRRGLTDDAPRALAIASSLGGAPVFSVPLPALALPGAAGTALDRVRAELRGALVEKLGLLAEAAREAGFRPALELLPGNVLGGSAEFLNLRSIPGLENLGLVLDTGHFHAMGEDVPALPSRMGGSIAATHLCDNDGIENLSLAPGAGNIPFRPLLVELAASGYAGSLDLEIVCAPGDVTREYRNALKTLRGMEAAEPSRKSETDPATPSDGIPEPMTARGPGVRGFERSTL